MNAHVDILQLIRLEPIKFLHNFIGPPPNPLLGLPRFVFWVFGGLCFISRSHPAHDHILPANIQILHNGQARLFLVYPPTQTTQVPESKLFVAGLSIAFLTCTHLQVRSRNHQLIVY